MVGHESDSVKKALSGMKVTYVIQEEQKGTGHAYGIALEAIDPSDYDTTIVGNGDHMMFYTPQSLKKVLKQHHSHNAVATCVTSRHPDVSSFGFGRILRDDKGVFSGIVEQRDATAKQQAITEFNSGLAIFNTEFAESALKKVSTSNAAGELYIVDLFNVGIHDDQTVIAVTLSFDQVGIGINSRDDYDMACALFEKLIK